VFYTVKKAAERLCVSTSTIYSLIAARQLEHVRVGLGRGVIRIPEEAIVAFEKRHAVPIADPSVTVVAPSKRRLRHLDL
jgi:excisionase family DNA binding protein